MSCDVISIVSEATSVGNGSLVQRLEGSSESEHHTGTTGIQDGSTPRTLQPSKAE